MPEDYDFLSMKIDELVRRAKNPSSADDVRFSVSFPKPVNRRLEYVRHSLRMTKQELIYDIVTAALTDIELRLDLVHFSEETGGIAPDAEYYKMMTSDKPVASYFKKKEDD